MSQYPSEDQLMLDMQESEQSQAQPRMIRRYCPFRTEGSKCSADYCALAINGVCAFTLIAVYLSVMAQIPMYSGDE